MKYAIAALALMATPALSEDLCFPTANLNVFMKETSMSVIFAGTDNSGDYAYMILKDGKGMWVNLGSDLNKDVTCVIGGGVNATVIEVKGDL